MPPTRAFVQDLRLGLRKMRRSPGFAATATLTVGFGVAVTTVIFTIVNSVLLRPLPYPEPEAIVAVWPEIWFSKEQFVRLRDEVRSYEHLAAYTPSGVVLSGRDRAEHLEGPEVSAEFFRTLGVPAALGRAFVVGDDAPGRDQLAVLSNDLWLTRFGGDPDAIGRSVVVDGRSRTVVGVMPAGFDFVQPEAVMALPLTLDSGAGDYRAHYLRVIGRLAPEVSREAAQQELRSLAQRWEGSDEIDADAVRMASVRSLRDQRTGDVRRTLYVLAGAVALLLLLSCANVANLFLARALGRGKEVALRRALGAGRSGLLRQFLAESLVLTLLGGAMGLGLAVLGLEALIPLLPDDLPRLAEVSVDYRVLLFALAVSALVGVAFGLLPVVQARGLDLVGELKEGTRGTTRPGRRRGAWGRNALVVTQVAMAVILVIGGGLLARSFHRLAGVDPGFRPEGVLTMRVQPPENGMETPEALLAFHEETLTRLAGLPGVGSVAAIHTLPIGGGGWVQSVQFEGQTADTGEQNRLAYYRLATPDYFRTMGIPLLSGRLLEPNDRAGTPAVALINRSLADRYLPGEEPVGRRLRIGDEESGDWLVVVGVVGDVRLADLGSPPQPTLYLPYPQAVARLHRFGVLGMSYVLRSLGDPGSHVRAAVATVGEVNPGAAASRTVPMLRVIDESIAGRRLTMLMLAFFAVSSLGLGAIGIYGVMSYLTGERVHEVGIRMALGARGGDVLALVLWQALRLAGLGLLLGVVGGLALSRVMRGLVFGISAVDPVTFVAGPVILVVTALLASYLPARRAAAVQPVEALRE